MRTAYKRNGGWENRSESGEKRAERRARFRFNCNAKSQRQKRKVEVGTD